MKFQDNIYIIPPLSEIHCYWWKAKWLLDLMRVWLPIPITYSLSYIDLENQDFLWKAIPSILSFPLILRSSANFEDSIRYSFAWLFESYVCYAQWDILEALHSMKYFTKKNIQLAYPHFDSELLRMNIIIQPYLVCEFSWVFISKWDTHIQGYGECVYGQPNRILHNGEMDVSFLLWRLWIQFEWVIPEEYKHLIYNHLLLVQNYFSDRSYQYEWCISQGIFYFLQKRPFFS